MKPFLTFLRLLIGALFMPALTRLRALCVSLAVRTSVVRLLLPTPRRIRVKRVRRLLPVLRVPPVIALLFVCLPVTAQVPISRVNGLQAALNKLTRNIVSITNYGAVGNTRVLSFSSGTAGSPNITISNGNCTAADVGKTFAMPNGGAVNLYKSVIVSVTDATHIVCADNVTNSVSNSECFIGTDCTNAFSLAVTAAGVGGSVYIPAASGMYLNTAPIALKSGQTLYGAGPNASVIAQIHSNDLTAANSIINAFCVLVNGTAPDDDLVTYNKARGDWYASVAKPFARGTVIGTYKNAIAFVPSSTPTPHNFCCTNSTDLASLSQGMAVHLCEGWWQPNPARSQIVFVDGTSTITAQSTAAAGTGVTLTVSALTHRVKTNDILVFNNQGVLTVTADAEVGATSIQGTVGGALASSNASITTGDVCYCVHTLDPITTTIRNDALSFGQITSSNQMQGKTRRYADHIWQFKPSTGANLATSGSFEIVFAAANPTSVTTGTIGVNDSLATIQTTLDTALGAGNSRVTGGPLSAGAPITIEMIGANAKTLYATSPTITANTLNNSATITVGVFQNGQAQTGTPGQDAAIDLWNGDTAGDQDLSLFPTAGWFRINAITDVTVHDIGIRRPLGESLGAMYAVGVFHAARVNVYNVRSVNATFWSNNSTRVTWDNIECDCSLFALGSSSYRSTSVMNFFGNGCNDVIVKNSRFENSAVWFEEGAQNCKLLHSKISNIRDETAIPLEITGAADNITIDDVQIDGNNTGCAILSAANDVIFGPGCVMRSNGKCIDTNGYLYVSTGLGAAIPELFDGRAYVTIGGRYFCNTTCIQVGAHVDVYFDNAEIQGGTGGYGVSSPGKYTGNLRRRSAGVARGVPFPSPAIIMSAGTQVSSQNGEITYIKTGGADVTLTSTPTINATNVQDAQICTVINVDSAHNIIFQDNGTLAGSAIHLGAATRTLKPGGQLSLRYDLTNAVWWEILFSSP